MQWKTVVHVRVFFGNCVAGCQKNMKKDWQKNGGG